MPQTPPIRLRLAEVRLERFKAAFKPKNPIALGDFNAIIGRNGAGKSTVIEALQWIDTALRSDVRKACERYNGVHDLINHRKSGGKRSFKITLKWVCPDNDRLSITYSLQIEEGADTRTPYIDNEALTIQTESSLSTPIITLTRGERRYVASQPSEPVPFPYKERLLLSVIFARDTDDSTSQYLGALRTFWANTVFLRLSPNEMAKLSEPTRTSYSPLLDETGRNLPALLRELNKDQLSDLVRSISRVLPGFSNVEVSRPIIPQGEVFYSLTESLPYSGRQGKKKIPIPAWMLSEGTRRITAIFALLRHEPKPSFLCIEEIENGLDPWSVIEVIQELQSAASDDVQVTFTSHSPWLLDHVQTDEILHVQREDGETVYSRFADKEEVKAYKGKVPPGSIYATEDPNYGI